MKDTKLKIRPAAGMIVAAEDVRTLLEAGNGDAALLYLHVLQNGGTLDADRAATDLHRSDRDIETAADRLRRMGLLRPEAARPVVPEPARELPEYRAEDIVRPGIDSAPFQALVEEVQASLGRILSSADLKKLFGIYDALALPPDVILLLVQHCKEEYAARYGRERNVGFAFIEKEAYDWFHRELLTYEQAERWLGELERRKSVIHQLRRMLGISDRALAPTERRYFNDWIERGFSAEAIALAADRTVTNTGGLKWNYMDKILHNWDQLGLHTPEEIEKGDKKPERRGKNGAGQPPRDETKTIDQMKRLREKINNG